MDFRLFYFRLLRAHMHHTPSRMRIPQLLKGMTGGLPERTKNLPVDVKQVTF